MPLPEEDFIRQSLILKSIPMVTSIILLICLAAASPVNGLGIPLFIGICTILICVFALALFVTNLQESVASSTLLMLITKREDLRWTAVEYTYCIVLATLNFVGTIQNWVLAAESRATGYIAATVFSVALVVMFAVNAAVIVRNYEETEQSERQPFARRSYEQLPY